MINFSDNLEEIEKDIKSILFEIGKDIKLHKLIDGNIIIEIDYDKYVTSLMNLIRNKLT
jgi:signal transduction histidine kinase